MSILDVAKRAGVSTATVSRVINDDPAVSPETARAVSEIVEQMQYRPRRSGPRRKNKRSGRMLKVRASAVLALVLPELRIGIFPSLVQSFDEAAREFAHQVLACNTLNSVAKQADVIVQLIQNRVAGVALMPTTVGPSAAHQIQHLQAAGIPVVFLHRGIEGASAPLIALPYELIGDRAASEVVAAGHSRVAMFFARQDAPAQLYRQGLVRGMAAAGYELSAELEHVGCGGVEGANPDEHEAGMMQALDRMLALPPQQRPTAIFAPWEGDAELLYISLIRRGIDVPSGMSLITLGSAWRGRAIMRRLCSVTIDEVEVGTLAVKLLTQMVRDAQNLESNERFLIPLKFYQGESLGPPARVARRAAANQGK